MNISFNPSSILENSANNSKVNFINKYGNFANNYNKLTSLGEQQSVWFYFITVMSLILTISLFLISKEEKDLDNKPIEKTSLKKTLRLVAWITLGIFIISFIYSGYAYLFSYLPQYNEWFKNLPREAQNELKILNNLDSLAVMARSNNNNYRNNNRYNTNSSLLNINLK
jgi:hypothetical protein